MRRVNLFLAILVASTIALLTLTIIGFNVPYASVFQQQHNGMGSGMMGQITTTTIATAQETSGYFWTAFAALAALLAVSVVGFAYYLAYPQVNIGAANIAVSNSTQTTSATPIVAPSVAYNSIEKTLTEDERKVINTLNLHQGKYLQKYITKEAGLSKLKTHRIVARLSERGIVTVEKTGNTNMVYLAEWLKKKESNP